MGRRVYQGSCGFGISMRDARTNMRTIESRIRRTGRVVLMLDFDGTISPFAKTPEAAVVSRSARASLNELRRYIPIVIVSGRPLSVVRKKMGIAGLAYIGSHGIEMQLGSRRSVMSVPARCMHDIAAVRVISTEIARKYKGVIIENKRWALSAHFRALSHSERRAFRAKLLKHTAPVVRRNRINVTVHDVALEFRPDIPWNKGTAARRALRLIGKGIPATPIYIGDEPSDEDVFRALPHGIMIRVGRSGGSAARYRFRTRTEVDRFLQRFLKLIRSGELAATHVARKKK